MKNPKVSRTSKKITKIVDKWAAEVKKDWNDGKSEVENPLSELVVMPDTIREVVLEQVPEAERQYYDFSTRVTGFDNKPYEGMVTILFDGLAWDFLSYESDFHLYRDRLEEMLENAGFYAENTSACAISIQER
jgi:hypothetical protein